MTLDTMRAKAAPLPIAATVALWRCFNQWLDHGSHKVRRRKGGTYPLPHLYGSGRPRAPAVPRKRNVGDYRTANSEPRRDPHGGSSRVRNFKNALSTVHVGACQNLYLFGDVFDALIETAPIAAEVFHDPDHTR